MYHTAVNQAHSDTASPAPLVVAVEFGQPLANGDCGHVGICRTEDIAYPGAGSGPCPSPKRCRHATALVSVGLRGHVEFLFLHDSMLPCTVRAFFDAEDFEIPGDYTLPEHWQSLMPRLTSLQLAAGRYPIEKSESGFLVRF
jgi:hypothetical protein